MMPTELTEVDILVSEVGFKHHAPEIESLCHSSDQIEVVSVTTNNNKKTELAPGLARDRAATWRLTLHLD